jgi:uncharacterized protein (DUF1800 family)
VWAAPLPNNPASDVAFLNRATWGVSGEAELTAFHAMGLEHWIAWQLHPRPTDMLPAAAQAQIDAMAALSRPMTQLVADLAAQSRTANLEPDPDTKKTLQQAYQQTLNDVARQAIARDVLRDLYSPSQVLERMAWFWTNHFNIHQYKADIRPMLADWQDTIIRPHALGRFRNLLGATALHPAMIRYLDNAENATGHANENYARELMELHTMGVGSGYTQRDVEELARVFTGIGIDARAEDPKLPAPLKSQLVRDGLYEFSPARHDYGDKIFLGQTIKGRGLDEVREVLDILARQPATAAHVSRQIAEYFLPGPPPALVARMTDAFTKSDGDIAAVLGVMLRSAEFAAPGLGKFKDPVRYVLSAVRLAYNGRVVLNVQPVIGWTSRLGEAFYNHDTPDGFANGDAAWNGPGQMATRFEVARQIGSGGYGMFRPPGEGTVDRPGFPLLQNGLWFLIWRRAISSTTSASLDQAVSPQDWNTLFLASPEFNQ